GGDLDVNGNNITSDTGFLMVHTGDTALDVFAIGSSGGKLTKASGNQRFLEVLPNINQSGSATYTILDIDVTETATGSGSHNFFDFRVSSTSKITGNSAGTIIMTGDLMMEEKADHSSTPEAGYGYLWTKNTAPSTLIFTDDAGTDFQLGVGSSGGLLADGSVPLTGNWTTGAFDIDMTGGDLTVDGISTVALSGDDVRFW
ncbi:unnamed protein product, partial [marine sediment metagenome]